MDYKTQTTERMRYDTGMTGSLRQNYSGNPQEDNRYNIRNVSLSTLENMAHRTQMDLYRQLIKRANMPPASKGYSAGKEPPRVTKEGVFD